MLDFFPSFFTRRAISIYLALLAMLVLLFMSHTMTWYMYVFGLMEVVGFFYFANTLTVKWQYLNEKRFAQKLFWTALIVRVVWVIFAYYFYTVVTGYPFEFGAADSLFYNDMAQTVRSYLGNGQGYPPIEQIGGELADIGYPYYLGTVYHYLSFGNEVFIPRLLKCVWSALTCFLVYKLAARNFGESVGRMGGIFCMLMPNLIYYCGLHLKETEMVFLAVAFVERTDYIIRTRDFSVINIVLPILFAILLFFFRTVLGAVALFSFVTALMFVSGRVLQGWKRAILVVWVGVAVGFLFGSRLMTEAEEMWQNRDQNQETSFTNNRSNELVNKALTYKTAFIPAAFIIPLPTQVETAGQQNLKIVSGGLYVKNVMVFFLLMSAFLLIRRKQWRDHTLMATFLVGYIIVLAMSAFLLQERFHIVAIPFVMVFAAYGISQATNRTKLYYDWYIVALLGVIVVWNYMKLSGRGAF